MGNHEFCENCGENNFHLHRDCDPEKVAERLQNEREYQERKEKGLAKMKALLDSMGIKYRIHHQWQYAEIDPLQFAD